MSSQSPLPKQSSHEGFEGTNPMMSNDKTVNSFQFTFLPCKTALKGKKLSFSQGKIPEDSSANIMNSTNQHGMPSRARNRVLFATLLFIAIAYIALIPSRSSYNILPSFRKP